MASVSQDYLSIRQVADLLSLEYKAVWRQVQSGELPAIRVGGVWRVPKDALLRRLQPGASPSEAGQAPAPSGPAAPAPPAGSAQAPPMDVVAHDRRALARDAFAGTRLCSRCARFIADEDVAGACVARHDAPAPLCAACVQHAALRLCSEHLAERPAMLAALGPPQVSAVHAQQMEGAYLAMWEQRVRAIVTLRDPSTGATVASPHADGPRPRRLGGDALDEIMAILGTAFLSEDLLLLLPRNRWLAYEWHYSDPQGIGRTLVLGVRCLSHLGGHCYDLVDTRKAGEGDLRHVLRPHLTSDAPPDAGLWAVASTTGFTPDLWQAEGTPPGIPEIGGAHLLLVDLLEERLRLLASDQRLLELAPLFVPHGVSPRAAAERAD